jgi:hypothetical protein
MRTRTRLVVIGWALCGLALAAPGMAAADQPAVQPDTAAAGYFSEGLAPTSASAVVVVPTFTCAGTQLDILSTGMTWLGNGAESEVLVNCAGAGQTPVLSAMACATSNCVTSVAVAAGDRVKMSLSSTAKGTRATLTDETTKDTETAAGGVKGAALDATFTLDRIDAKTVAFSKVAFSTMTVDGVPLTTATSFAQDMTSARPIVQVHAVALVTGRGTLIFKHV